MVLTGNEFLGVAKRNADNKIANFLSSEKFLTWSMDFVIA